MRCFFLFKKKKKLISQNGRVTTVRILDENGSKRSYCNGYPKSSDDKNIKKELSAAGL